MQLDKLLVGLGLSSTGAELAVFALVMVAISLAFWLVVGRFRLHNTLINIYIAFAVMKVLPNEMTSLTKFFEVYFFIGFLLLLSFFMKYIFEIHLSGPGLVYWQAILMSFFEVGLILSISFSLLPQKEVGKFVTGEALFYFISPWSIAVWMLLPLVFLVFLNRR